MKTVLSLILMFSAAWAHADLKVVTTTTDLAAIVRAVGQDKVKVLAIARGTQDPHHIEAKPSYMMKMRDADLVVAQGLELELAWVQPLIHGARNPKINMGGDGYLELGDKLNPIEVPRAGVTRAEGDVHPGGNPHFQLDPIRVGKAAVIIANRMGELDANNADFYLKNAQAFQKHLEDKTKEWSARLAKTGIKEVVTYHKTLSYFFKRFGITTPIQLEPKPGIPPTAGHLLEVVREMKKLHIHLILIESYYDQHAADKIKETLPGITVASVPVSVGGEPDIKTNEQLFEKVVEVFEAAAKK